MSPRPLPDRRAVRDTTSSPSVDLTKPSRQPATADIEVIELGFTYPGASRPAIDTLTFDVRRGEVVGFLGPSGAGKSTTQMILTGRLRGASGSVRVLGEDPTSWRGRDLERVGVSFEQPALFAKLTAREQLAFFASLYERPTRDPDELLAALDLAEHADLRAAAYSKGMRVRLDLARALLHRPDVLFLDEPTAGLDPTTGRRVRDVIAAERARGCAVLLTTHDMTLAAALSDRVALLSRGRLVAFDTPRRLVLDGGGDRRVAVTTADGEVTTFPLPDLADDPRFLDLLHSGDVATIHTTEPTLGDVFVRLTGEGWS